MSKQKQIPQKRQAYWQKVIQRWQKSGWSVREFCRRHQIPETSFYQGRRRLAGFSSRPPRLVSKDPFVEVKLDPLPVSPTRLEIVWPQPPVVKVYAGCEEKLLEQTLRGLREPTC